METIPEIKRVKTFKTYPFRVHAPSRCKLACVRDAMTRAHRGYDALLRVARPYADNLVRIEECGKDIGTREKLALKRRMLWRELREILQKTARTQPLGSGPKQAIQEDALAHIKSYVALKRDYMRMKDEDKARRKNTQPSYPESARLNPALEQNYEKGLEKLVMSLTREEENEARDMMARKTPSGLPRPLSILANRVKDGMLLLKNEKTGRLVAFVNLHGKDSRWGNRNRVEVKEMTNMRTGEVISFRSRTGILLPLETSDALGEKMQGGRIQSSRLVMRDACTIDLMVTLAYETDSIGSETYLGVDRGIETLAAWAVCDQGLAVKETGRIDGTKLRDYQRFHEAKQRERQRYGRFKSRMRWAGYSDHIVHCAANELVCVARKHRAQVVLEDLTALSSGPHHKRPKGQRRAKGFNRMLSRAQYQKLKTILSYKLTLEGLPEFVEVRPAYTSRICNLCGHEEKANRLSQEAFACLSCGHKAHADINAATNIAVKGLWYQNVIVGRKKGQKLRDDEKFDAWLSAHRRGAAA